MLGLSGMSSSLLRARGSLEGLEQGTGHEQISTAKYDSDP